MPLTKLDEKPALIVIDLQKGIVAMPTVHPAAEIVARAAQLARAFRKRRFPVVLVNVTSGAPGRTDFVRPKIVFTPDWSELVPELDRQPSDLVISKQRVGAFIGTSLHDDLQKLGVTQVFIIGISTSAGVESTARSAYDHGYNVVFVADATTDRDPLLYQHGLEKTFPRLGEIAKTDDVLKALE